VCFVTVEETRLLYQRAADNDRLTAHCSPAAAAAAGDVAECRVALLQRYKAVLPSTAETLKSWDSGCSSRAFLFLLTGVQECHPEIFLKISVQICAVWCILEWNSHLEGVTPKMFWKMRVQIFAAWWNLMTSGDSLHKVGRKTKLLPFIFLQVGRNSPSLPQRFRFPWGDTTCIILNTAQSAVLAVRIFFQNCFLFPAWIKFVLF